MHNKVSRVALACALGATCLAVPTAISAQDNVPQRPNILLIIADDIGQDLATGMYPGLIDRLSKQYGPDGHDNPNYGKIDGTPASTPTLDRFAQQGMTFTDGWAQPFC